MDSIAENIDILSYTMRLIRDILLYLLYGVCIWAYTSALTSIGYVFSVYMCMDTREYCYAPSSYITNLVSVVLYTKFL